MAQYSSRLWETPRYIHRKVRITTTGSAGSATGAALVDLPPGVLTHVQVDYNASAPATTDLTIADGSGGTALLTLTNTNTDVAKRALGSPNAVDEGRAVTAATDATAGGAFYNDSLYISVAQADALAPCVTVDLWVEVLRYVEVNVRPAGADGSATAAHQIDLHGAGVLRGLSLDFQNQPATTDLSILADSSAGDTLFTSTNSATDLTKVGLGCIGIDEAGAAIAATDASTGGQPFATGLHITVAQGDGQTSGDEVIVVGLWLSM